MTTIERKGTALAVSLVVTFFILTALLFIRGCRRSSNTDRCCVRTETKYVYLHDTIRETVFANKFVPVKEIVPRTDTIVVRDTVMLVADYFTERIYEYEYADSCLRFNSDIVVKENALLSIRTDYEVYREKVIVEKTTVREPKFRLSAGLGLYGDVKHNTLDVGVTVGVGYKRNNVSLGYGFRFHGIGVGYSYDIISR